jgi:hypothetical protein
MLTSVHQWPPPSVTCPDASGAAAGERRRTGMNETTFETANGRASGHPIDAPAAAATFPICIITEAVWQAATRGGRWVKRRMTTQRRSVGISEANARSRGYD